MIYQVKLILRGEERDITEFKYSCHVSHHDDPNLDKMIELHQQICKEIGNEEPLPVEGDLIELTFNSTDHDQLLYDWMFLDAMQDGEIHFIYNEVETADIFRFWDCYCIGLEERMSAGGQPMTITVFLSPAIIKRNNMEPREKEWKVSSISISNKNINPEVSYTSNMDGKASAGVNPIKIILKVIHVKPPFILKKKFQDDPTCESEMKRQLQMQEDGINEMNVADWLKNRAAFKNKGRNPYSDQWQQLCREKYRKVLQQKFLLT